MILLQAHSLLVCYRPAVGSRAGLLAKMSSPGVRYFALLLLVLGQAPAVVASLMMVGGLRSDHEFQCDFNCASLNVTLHHLGEPTDHPHGHNWAERLFVGKSVSNNEPDHHFGYDRPSALSEEDLGSAGCDHDVPCAIPTAAQESAGARIFRESSQLRVAVDLTGLSPPRVERRGVVMRV